MHTRKSTSCALTHQLRLEFGQGAQLFLLLVTSKAKRHHAKPAVAKKRKKHTRFKPSYPTVRHRPPPPLELERLKVALPQSPPASRNVTDLSTSSTQLMWEKATCRQAARQSHEKKGKKTPTDRPTVRPHDGGPSLVMSSLHLAATNMHTSSAAPRQCAPAQSGRFALMLERPPPKTWRTRSEETTRRRRGRSTTRWSFETWRCPDVGLDCSTRIFHRSCCWTCVGIWTFVFK